MRGVSKLLLVLVVAAALASALGACGGGDETDSSTPASRTTTPGATATTATEGSSGQGSGSSSFRTPGGDNSIQNFGEEGDADEVAAASAALEAFMKSRAKDQWVQVCNSLSKAAVAPLAQLASGSPQLKGRGCAAILAALTGTAPASTRANTLIGPVASLRFEGDRGFALYHGPKGVNYFVPMTKEDGEWRVGALAPSEFP